MPLSPKFDIIIPPQDIDCEPGLQNKLAAGNREAFAWVYKNYSKKVFNYALIITGNEQQSEDIVQDVFVKLWQHREKLRDHENFNGYFRLLYKNHVMNVMRNSGRERTNKKNYLETAVSHSNSVEEIINYKETKRLIADAVKDLARTPRQVYELKEHDMKNGEIANLLHKSEKTVRNQLHTALKFLRERLSQ